MTRTLAAIALGAAMVAAPALAPGSATAQTETQQQQQLAPEDVTDAMLQTFAAATVEVRKVVEVYQPRIEQAESAEDADGLRREAQAKMIEAVEAEGLSVDEYNQIASLARDDETFRSTVEKHIEEAQ